MDETNAKFLIITSVFLVLSGSVRTFAVGKQSFENEHEEKVGHHRAKDDLPKLSFAKPFQDHMVLQQAPARANIYGFSPFIGRIVTLQVVPDVVPVVYETAVKPGPEAGVGVWSITLDPVKTNISVLITVESGGDTIAIFDVVFGDVWVCSGQSNMEFTVIQMLGAEEEVSDAHNYPLIRIMTVENVQSSTPLYDLRIIRQNWTVPSNNTVGGPAWRYFSAVCWLYGKAIHKALGYPIGLVATDWGGTPVEAWSSKDALTKCGVNSTSLSPLKGGLYQASINSRVHEDQVNLEGPSNNSFLWNAMIYPLLNMTIKGAIWYQGENDASGEMMARYNCTFPAMISDWREKFHNFSNGETDVFFPFGFVQLAPNRPNPEKTVGFPDIRWHQTGDFGYVPNIELIKVFMAVAMDLPDFNSSYGSVHPRDKKDVGDRLTLAGLAVAYAKDEIFQGPLPEGYEILGDGVRLLYGPWWSLVVRTPTGFEFQCGAERLWVPTNITASTNTSVTLARTCSPDRQVTAVRYAWRESPCQFKKCAVYETVQGLPGPPFVAQLSESPAGKFPFEFDGRRYKQREM